MIKTVKSQKSKIFSWILYDFANTIYSFIVVTYYLPPLLEKATRSNFLMSFATIFSMIFAGMTAPVLGALTDRSRAAKKWLIISTLLCCAACSGIGIVMRGSLSFTGSRITVIFFTLVIANYTYQVGLMFYNSFLPTLGGKKRPGKDFRTGYCFWIWRAFFYPAAFRTDRRYQPLAGLSFWRPCLFDFCVADVYFYP